MNIRVRYFYQSFGLFINSSGRYFLFTSLLYSLWLVHACAVNQTFELQSFNGRMIGIATLENYDIGARVSLFYKSIATFFCSFLLFNLLAFFISRKFPQVTTGVEIKIVNYSSIAGILFLFYSVLGYKTANSMELVYFMHKLMLGAILLKQFFFKNNHLTLYNYTLIFLIAASFYFFVSDICRFAGFLNHPDFLITCFIICCLLITGAFLMQKSTKENRGQKHLAAIAYSFAPLAFLPFLSVLKDEVFLVLKHNGIILSSSFLIYTGFILMLAGIVYLRYRKTADVIPATQKRLLSHYYFPVVIFSLVSFVNYSYIINYSDEMFEAGNKYLAVMEFDLFGVIPTLEKFNSHLLSDYFYMSIYALFNGLGDDMQLYEFLNSSFSFLLYYYLLLYVTRNGFVAAFIILLFPLCTAMLPEQYAFGVLGLIALNKMIQRAPSLKNYFLFFLTLLFLVLWRIDLGYACLGAMVLMVLYYHFFSLHFKINLKFSFQSVLAITASILIILGALSIYRDTNLFKKAIYTLNYLSSAQTYGYPEIGPEETLLYKMHYFIFPLIVAAILLALIIQFRKYTKTRSYGLAYMALFFACLFYLMNFNRGLVRHGLVEKMDHFTVSYLYFIIASSVFVFFKKGTQVIKFAGFCVIGSFMLFHYKLPDPKGSESYAELLFEKLQSDTNVHLSKIETRIRNKTQSETEQNEPFIEFIKMNTGPAETYIDFSNNPMLYFYTQKITPSFFYQNPICSHNDFLQNVFIRDMNAYNTPYLLFARKDYRSYHFLDEVPDILRHYRISEHIYKDFEPYVMAGIFEIWKRKTHKGNNSIKQLYSYSRSTQTVFSDSLIKIDFPVDPKKKYLVKITLDKKIPLTFQVESGSGPVQQKTEYTADTVAYNIIEPVGDSCHLTLNKEGMHSLLLSECDYLPDFYGEAFHSYAFLKLPYVWGKLDKSTPKEKVLFENTASEYIEQGENYRLKIPDSIDKRSGNSIIVTCKNSSGQVQPLTLWFGKAHEKNKTEISFDVLPSEQEKIYVLRVSCIYKWHDMINQVGILNKHATGITVSKIQITKGN